jgi:hypothetical protein
LLRRFRMIARNHIRQVNPNETRQILVALCQGEMRVSCFARRQPIRRLPPLPCTLPIDLWIPAGRHLSVPKFPHR